MESPVFGLSGITRGKAFAGRYAQQRANPIFPLYAGKSDFISKIFRNIWRKFHAHQF